MADLDLTEAVDAAAEAIKTAPSTWRSTAPGWVVVTGHATTLARAVVTAAAPLIAAQVRTETQPAAAELLRRVDKVRDEWAEYGPGEARNRDLWEPMHRAADALRDALESAPAAPTWDAP